MKKSDKAVKHFHEIYCGNIRISCCHTLMHQLHTFVCGFVHFISIDTVDNIIHPARQIPLQAHQKRSISLIDSPFNWRSLSHNHSLTALLNKVENVIQHRHASPNRIMGNLQSFCELSDIKDPEQFYSVCHVMQRMFSYHSDRRHMGCYLTFVANWYRKYPKQQKHKLQQKKMLCCLS